jgi:hypothetical protein
LPTRNVESAFRQAGEIAENIAAFTRLTRDLPGCLRQTIGPEEARAQVVSRLAAREERFLTVAERAIYGHSNSPYLKLLRLAGCELGDLRWLVAQDGIEGALSALAGRGVYVTVDELKGRREAVRGSQRFAFRARDFDNPLIRPHMFRLTGGSGGQAGRVRYSLGLSDEWATSMSVVFDAHAIRRPRLAFWWPAPIP